MKFHVMILDFTSRRIEPPFRFQRTTMEDSLLPRHAFAPVELYLNEQLYVFITCTRVRPRASLPSPQLSASVVCFYATPYSCLTDLKTLLAIHSE